MFRLKGHRHVEICPLCGGEVDRVHRHPVDRLFSVLRSVHRYKCRDEACGWEGIVSNSELPDADAAAPRISWRTRALWFTVGAVVALGAAQATRMYLWEKAAREAREARALAAAKLPQAQDLPVPEGESYDGAQLAEDDLRQLDNPSPLTLRRGCAWGVPGRNPYKGTVSQALTAARLPESAVRKFESMVDKGLVSDRVEISRDGIKTESGRRKFDALSFDMAFGKTMCFNTRVNFHRGHVEKAALYEATDAEGKAYAVMIPEVCGNVAVLGARAERNGDHTNGSTPEPSTWAMFALGLALLAWIRGRRVFRVR